MSNVDQQRVRRTRTGLVAHDEGRAFNGYTLFQRLANGNTLVCEGCDGRIFEVTHDGEVVWEYINPHFSMERGRPGLNNWVFRAFRYTEDEIERARRA